MNNHKSNARRPEYRQAARYKWLIHMLRNSKVEHDHLQSGLTGEVSYDPDELVRLQEFSGSTLLFEDPSGRTTDQTSNVHIYWKDANDFSLLPKNFDSRCVLLNADVAPLVYSRCRRVSFKELRGYGKLPSDKIVHYSHAAIIGGKVHGSRRYYAFMPNKKWQALIHPKYEPVPLGTDQSFGLEGNLNFGELYT